MNTKKVIVKINMLHQGSDGVIAHLCFLAKTNVPFEDSGPIDGKREITFEFAPARMWAHEALMNGISRVFKPGLLGVISTEISEFRNKWEYFEYLLNNHDWTYKFADDHRYWQAGVKSEEMLRELAPKLMFENPRRYVETISPFRKNLTQWIPALL